MNFSNLRLNVIIVSFGLSHLESYTGCYPRFMGIVVDVREANTSASFSLSVRNKTKKYGEKVRFKSVFFVSLKFKVAVIKWLDEPKTPEGKIVTRMLELYSVLNF